MKSFLVHTLGCKVNSYESEAVKLLMLASGYFYDESKPDIIIVNTCSVTGMSAKKSRQSIRHFQTLHPGIVTVVMGCYAQLEAPLIAELTGAHIIVGTNNRAAIPALIEKYYETDENQVAIAEDKRTWKYETLSVTSYSDRTRAYVKIQDGCDNFCSYCLIPYARGKMRSRPKDDIFREIAALLDHGFHELVLTGIHTAGYGRDFSDYSFDDLIEEILKMFPTLFRLRISSIEASEITPRFLTLLKNEPRLARHLHVPLQSGSDFVLKAMNRHYDVASFVNKIKAIREAVSDIALTTDIIVGFPGETDGEFDNTYRVAEELGFSKIHVFPFSKRTGTRAANLKEEVSSQTIKDRVNRLLRLSEQLENAYATRFAGQPIEVVLEQYDETFKAYEGHSSHYLKAFVQGSELRKGMVVRCFYDVSGKPVQAFETIIR